MPSVLFLGKKDDRRCLEALEFTKRCFTDVTHRLGGWGEPFDSNLTSTPFDYVISYLSRWVVPVSVLEQTKKAAINFHPASPAYPGIGCNNFALYDGAKEYGVTCHHMASKVDVGSIIATKRFPIFEWDTVETLLERTYQFQLCLYFEVVGKLALGEPLELSGEEWERQPYSRKEFNLLGKITPDMDKQEIDRRVRATSFGQWQPTTEIGGRVFKLVSDAG